MSIDESELSDEQRQIVNHPIGTHARVLAGPGTGKSYTAAIFLGKLHDPASPVVKSKMLTFTRAATAEFAIKLVQHDLTGVADAPSTVHSHALAVLLNLSSGQLPSPLRIPDTWEMNQLVRPHLSILLRASGYSKATVKTIKKLENEMAAGWQTLDLEAITYTEASPALRAAYVGAWSAHRRVFGYSLLAELPMRAANALEDLGLDQPPSLDLLIVDEYQDLNAAEIRFIKAHADLGISILAIGDDDQSIYGYRWADPQGIIRFPAEFHPSKEYTLSVSHRCAKNILSVASELIASTPNRQAKPPLVSLNSAIDGLFVYVKYDTDSQEASAVAQIARERVNQGVEESQILLLVRSSADKWRQQLQPAFENVGLTLSSADWVRDALQDKKLRAIIALSRLHGNKEDSIAWWSITVALTNGVGHMFTDYVYKECQNGETWAHTLLRLHELGFPELSVTLANKVTDTINDSQKRLASLGSELEIWLAENPNSPWSDWLIAEAESSDWDNKSVGTQLSEAAVRLLSLVGSVQEAATSLNSFLNQLEKVGSDLALESGGIRLMSISQSKGLTVDTAIILGLEEGLIPLRRPSVDPDEERRLLYVALTRAKKVCIATMASRRFGSLARSGGGTAYQLRERSDLVSALSFGSPIRPDSLLEKLKEFGSQ